ncbi:MAG TPA: hypothetical protein VK536_09565 [Candidatus Limnocylindrales bacterium]|nr:hypothetical protein [Candidatus Limnocylindrales bacterium]
MKFGVFLYQPEPVEGVDYNFYRLKSESGIVGKANPEMFTNIAVFGDNYMAAKRPDWVSISAHGPALRTNKYNSLRWDIVCMTNPEAREYNLKIIADAAKLTPGISISSQHFAERDFCVCPRCVELWRQSGLSWIEWRAKTVTEFLSEVREIVKDKPLFVNCLPDPLLGKMRFGYDFEAMAQYADYFVIPLFSKAYPTPWYWETIARGYKSFLKKPMFVNFYVRGPNETWETVAPHRQIMTVAVRAARTGVDGIIFLAEKADYIREFQRKVVADKEWRKELEGYGGDEVLELFNRWEKLV